MPIGGADDAALGERRVDHAVAPNSSYRGLGHAEHAADLAHVLAEDDHARWVAGRIVDAGEVNWLVMGIERASAASTRLMQQDTSTPITGYPPEAIVIGEIRYVLDKRGAATCQLFGDVGGLGGLKKDRPAGHVERCRWWLYGAPGEDTLLVEQWGSDYRVLRGKKIVDGTIELIPGS
jgi:hypothetical protein